MSLVSALALLVAAPLVREPVGLGDWQRDTDPVSRRIASVMATESVRRAFVGVVPLYARVPSEARRGDELELHWLGGAVRAREIVDGRRTYLRVVNRETHRVLVPAGAVFGFGEREVCLGRDGVVPAEFGALFPALADRPGGDAPGSGWLRPAGCLPPLATGLLLHRPEYFHTVATNPLHSRFGVSTYQELTTRMATVRRLGEDLQRASAGIGEFMEGTAVGAVFLIAGEPAAAHVFGSNRVFREALPDLVMGVAAQARLFEAQVGRGRISTIVQRRRGATERDDRARALAFLRSVLPAKSIWSESYGEGHEVVLSSPAARTVGHAVLDHRRTVLHVGLYHLGRYWSDDRPGRPPPPLRPPTQSGSETAPGEVDRKARPTLAEKRIRERRPGPSLDR